MVLCSSDVFVEPETIVNGSTLIADLYDESFMPTDLREVRAIQSVIKQNFRDSPLLIMNKTSIEPFFWRSIPRNHRY